MDMNSSSNAGAVSFPAEHASSDATDAARWRALMASERIRIMGSAGFARVDGEWKAARDDLHIGLEIWSKHAAAHPSAEFPQESSRAQLIAYVDHIRAAIAKAGA